MANALDKVAFWLLCKGKISSEEYGDLILKNSAKAVSEAALKLFRANKISWSQYHRVVQAGQRDKLANARARMRAKLREAEQYIDGRKGHRDAQAGLPSLGKRRP